MKSAVLHVTTEVTLEYGITTKRFFFLPSQDDFEDHSAEICQYVNKIQRYKYECSEIAAQIHNAMIQTLNRSEKQMNPALLVLWRHNFQFALGSRLDTPHQAVMIVCSEKGIGAKVILENLFTSIYPQNPIKVMDEPTFFQLQRQRYQAVNSPDVFEFSSGDGNCWDVWPDTCKRIAADFVQRYGKTSTVVMVTGEPVDIDGLDKSVLLISTVSQRLRKKHVYIPMASMVFTAVPQSPMQLLRPDHVRTSRQPLRRKFCAYMYARCDRPQREYMFDLLNAMEPVDALGVCQGTSQNEKTERWRSRLQMSAFQDAVDIYTQYKFVIAFENAQRPGYVTEKLVNAFLAGSIPIYLGHSDTISQLFNPKSFVDCGRFVTLRECALRVMEVHQSVELYGSMLREPVIGNVTRFHELFSWHPDVPSLHLANQIASLVAR